MKDTTNTNEHTGRDERPKATQSPAALEMRDYFAAHAPRHPWESYEPVFAEPEPIQDGELLGSLEAWREAWSAWRSRYVEAYDKQWPWYYADAMLAEREREAPAAIDAPQVSEGEVNPITMDDPPDHQIDEMLVKEPDE